jgi:hypothetical protein
MPQRHLGTLADECYSSQRASIWTDGDLYVGYGGASPPYGFNSPQQKVHIINTADIQGRPDTGVDIINTNSVPGSGYEFFYSKHSLPRRIRRNSSTTYSYEKIIFDPEPTTEFYRSNVYIGSTLSTMTFSNVYYTSSITRNNLNVSSIKTLPVESQYNEILGISTILSSFILNIDYGSISSLKTNGLTSLRFLSTATVNTSNLVGAYANAISTQIGYIAASLSNTSNALSNIQPSNWSYFPSLIDVDFANFSLKNVRDLVFSNYQPGTTAPFLKLSYDVQQVDDFTTRTCLAFNDVGFMRRSPITNAVITFNQYQTSYFRGGDDVITSIYPDFTFGYMMYEMNTQDEDPIVNAIASDWWRFASEGAVDFANNSINNVSTVNTTNLQLPFLNPITGNESGVLVISTTQQHSLEALSQESTLFMRTPLTCLVLGTNTNWDFSFTGDKQIVDQNGASFPQLSITYQEWWRSS